MAELLSLRIDIDSRKGLVEGVPKILDILKKNKQKASFYIPMGGESNIIELLKYRGGGYGKGIAKHSLFEKLRMVLFPHNFAKVNKDILKRIIDEGHELGVHGWKHRPWTRGLDKIDINNHLKKSVKMYKNLFGASPNSFAAPGFNTNKDYLKALDNNGFKIASDLDGKEPFHPKNCSHVQVPITIRNGINPLIESLMIDNINDSQALEILTKEIKDKDLATIYIHAEYECIENKDLLENM